MTNLPFILNKNSWFYRLGIWLTLASQKVDLVSHSENDQEQMLVLKAVKDPQAFNDLYHRYIDRIYVYHLTRSASREEAEDLTSQTFLAALEGISGYRKQASFSTWLFSIARRKLVDYYRRPKHVPIEIVEKIESNLEDEVDHRLTLKQICGALNQLAPERVEVLSLRIFGQLSSAETGQILSKSEGAVRTLLYRSLQELRLLLPLPVDVEEK